MVLDDDHVPGSQESYEEPRDDSSGTSTPPTPGVSPLHDPPPLASPLRQRAMAQLRPVSIPAVIKDMADKTFSKTLRDFNGNLRLPGAARRHKHEDLASACLEQCAAVGDRTHRSPPPGRQLWVPLDGFKMQTAGAMMCDSHHVP